VNNSYFVSNFRFKFEFDGKNGNNIYIDDINVYKGAASGLGLGENIGLDDVSLYPNPANKEINVSFSIAGNEDVVLSVQDITGKVAQTNLVKAIAGSNLVMLNTESLSSGMYFLKIQTGSSQNTLQFVVK
jgi:hypothetical protein